MQYIETIKKSNIEEKAILNRVVLQKILFSINNKYNGDINAFANENPNFSIFLQNNKIDTAFAHFTKDGVTYTNEEYINAINNIINSLKQQQQLNKAMTEHPKVYTKVMERNPQ